MYLKNILAILHKNETPIIDISSTEIRELLNGINYTMPELINQESEILKYLDKNVYEYILENKLYK